jgi:hypothetical protein
VRDRESDVSGFPREASGRGGHQKCVKTGCRLEARPLATSQGLRALRGLLVVVTVLLLQLRMLSRSQDERVRLHVVVGGQDTVQGSGAGVAH